MWGNRKCTLAGENKGSPSSFLLGEGVTWGVSIDKNTNATRRYGFGTWRDYVIGISVVNDQGHEVKAGGRVVKNVAGYDMCKLYIGSLGTLGIITQLTLKLKPRPEQHALFILDETPHSLHPCCHQLHVPRTLPVS